VASSPFFLIIIGKSGQEEHSKSMFYDPELSENHFILSIKVKFDRFVKNFQA
jgi:hypothetical protein